MIDLDVNPPDDGMLDKLKSKLARQLLPKMLENMKNTVQQAVDGIVESEGQAVDNDYSTRFEINDRESTGIVTILLGPISGPFDTVVQAHTRTTKNNGLDANGHTRPTSNQNRISSHTRHYEGERPFQLPNGNWVTSNHIPAELARDAGRKALGE